MNPATESSLALAAAAPVSATPAERAADGQRYRDALTCLAESDVRWCVLRDRVEDFGALRDLDLLVHPSDRALAAAALGRAGFVVRHDRRLRQKWVFVHWTGHRFLSIDLHAAFVQGGLEYMSARLALGRLDRSGPVPRLAPEDQFLHLVFHNLLGKRTLQEKHVPQLRALHDAGLDKAKLDEQARAFGVHGVVQSARVHFEGLVAHPNEWSALARRARQCLLVRPANLLGALRYAHGDRWRWQRRPVVLALLGPDGSGKTSFADALEALLRDSPLRAGRVYMGCWGHDLLPMRAVRRLIPPQRAHVRLFLARVGVKVALGEEEEAILLARPSPLRLGWNAVRYALKNVIFHGALGVEMSWRYVRHIALSRRPVVITDRYVYDLEFRQGKVPFWHGARTRRALYRIFPAPDGILYLTTPYDLVEKRKPQLDRTQFETMDRVFRSVLQPFGALLIQSDAPADDMARAFLTQQWETIVERCNHRA